MTTYRKWNKKKLQEERDAKRAGRIAVQDTAMPFIDFLNGGINKNRQIGVSTTMVLHPTGFHFFDYGVGSYLTVKDMDDNPLRYYRNIGLPGGSFNIFIAKSQGGKTTFAIQSGAATLLPWIHRNLVKEQIEKNIPPKEKAKWSEGKVFIQICDSENTADMNYIRKLTKFTNKMLRDHVIITPVVTDKDLIRCVQRHAQYKAETMIPEYSIMTDLYGNPIKEYPLTVLVCDSITQLVLEDCDDALKPKKGESIEEIYEAAVSGFAGAQRARVLNQLYTQLVNYSNKYNIMIIGISHINKSPPQNGRPTRSSRMLNVGEAISGGEKQLYLATDVIRIDVVKNIGGKSSTAVNLGDGIKGFVSVVDARKCKTNGKRNICHMVYTTEDGYDPLLSDIWHMKEEEKLAKKGNMYYLDRYPDFKFPMRYHAIHETFADHPEMMSALLDQVNELAEPLLDNPDDAIRADRRIVDEVGDSEVYDPAFDDFGLNNPFLDVVNF